MKALNNRDNTRRSPSLKKCTLPQGAVTSAADS